MMSLLVNDPYYMLRPYVPGKPAQETQREFGIEKVIKLASNENPLGPSKKVILAIQNALPKIYEYPDGSTFYLKEVLADFLKNSFKLPISKRNLILGNGSNEIIEMLIRTCIRPNENIIYVNKSFIIYKLCALSSGREIREVYMKDLRFDLNAISEAIDENTKLVFIANPNNPTGTYNTKKELDHFIKNTPPHVLIVLDEAYFEYVRAKDYPNGLDYLNQRERIIILRTFSKCYGLAGIRLGYGVSHFELIDYLNRGRQPFNVNTLVQVGALAALEDQEHINKSVSLTHEGLDILVPQLRTLGLKVLDSQANFIFVDFGRDILEIFNAMLHHGVIIRPLHGYGLMTSARITIGTKEQNEHLLDAIRSIL